MSLTSFSPLKFNITAFILLSLGYTTRHYIGVDSLSAEPVKIALDPLGNIYVAGKNYSNEGRGDYLLIKYKHNGGRVWVREYNSEYNLTDEARAIVTDKNGNIIVTGMSYINSVNRDYITLKYNSSGILQWTQRYFYNETTDDRAKAISIDDSGYVYVTGISVSPYVSRRAVTIKYDPDGEICWIREKVGADGEGLQI